MDLVASTEDADLSIESIVGEVQDEVESLVSDIACLDEDIMIQMREYENCRDSDYRILYHEDITGLLGQRSGLLDELYESIEAGREALGKVEMALEAAIDRLGDLEAPDELNISVPPVYASDSE